jgi:hypothetical protein
MKHRSLSSSLLSVSFATATDDKVHGKLKLLHWLLSKRSLASPAKLIFRQERRLGVDASVWTHWGCPPIHLLLTSQVDGNDCWRRRVCETSPCPSFRVGQVTVLTWAGVHKHGKQARMDGADKKKSVICLIKQGYFCLYK